MTVKCNSCGGKTVFLSPGITTNRNYYKCKTCDVITSRPIQKPSRDTNEKQIPEES